MNIGILALAISGLFGVLAALNMPTERPAAKVDVKDRAVYYPPMPTEL